MLADKSPAAALLVSGDRVSFSLLSLTLSVFDRHLQSLSSPVTSSSSDRLSGHFFSKACFLFSAECDFNRLVNQIMEDNQPVAVASGDEINDVVKERSRDQREALSGEPKCVICGRYGLLPTTPSCLPKGYLSELLRRKLEIHVKGDVVPGPVLSFSSCSRLPQRLIQNIEAAGYDMPTPVQMQAIPAALSGKNLLVSADTGSGKTASFLVPVISRCANFRLQHLPNEKKKPLAMVLTPTRELCIQVEDQAKLLGKGLPFKTALVVGGDAMAGQIYRIQQGVELIVGTPGRLIDLLMKHDVELDETMIFVLDEVDCMLERGFRDQVMQIFRALPQPQILMYSATISPEVEKMTSSMVKDIVHVSVGKLNKPNKAVKQIPIWVESKKKKQKLFDILMSKQHFMPPVIVYVGSRLGADLLSNAITVTTGMKSLSIHGEKPMKERRGVMKSFLMGEVPVIVATGVLGRGVDLLGVRQVIVFDLPNSIKEYVHQIGRASRLGEEGTAIVLVNEENKNLFPELVEILKSSGAAIPRELINSRYTSASVSLGKGYKKRKHGY
ncbi:hypothetical protein Q3G72_027423 [Acer saccharum]|nr:hypothetical protein Q3G72_027423 [Acer saccharum]